MWDDPLLCKNVHDFFGEAIDRTLPAELQSEFYRHLDICPNCWNDFFAERFGKALVRKYVARVPTPDHVALSIRQNLHHLSSESSLRRIFSSGFFQKRFLVPSLATGAAALAFVFYLLFPPSSAHISVAGLAPNDIIRQTHENFELIRQGKLKPSIVSRYPELVVGFFERKDIRFAVFVPPLEGCDWYGALSNEYNDVKLAHVVYQIGSDFVYLYQVDKKDVFENSKLSLPDRAIAAINQTGWFTDIVHEDCTIVVWVINGTLCAAASTLKKERLLALLKTP